jgi:CRISPR-associated exonuclease Cas4
LFVFDLRNYNRYIRGDSINIITFINLILFLFAIFFFYKSRKIYGKAESKKNRFRIPDGKITYSDLNVPSKALFSKRLRIAGKPDYIIMKNGGYIPIEVKSGSYPSPQRNHIFQLAAYCQLVEDNYRSFVPYGIIVYKEVDYKIAFDPKLRFELETVVRKMRALLRSRKVALNHKDPSRCMFCSMKKWCKDKLV